MSPHSSLIRCLILSLSLFFFFELSPFSLPFLGQANARSAPKATSSLESKGSEGTCCSPFTVLPLPSPFCAFPLPFLPMTKPPLPFPSFSHFAKVSSPFLQRAACSLTETTKKSKEQEEESPPQEANTGPFCLFFFFFFLFLLYLFLALPFFFFFFLNCLLLQVLTWVLEILSSWFLRWL